MLGGSANKDSRERHIGRANETLPTCLCGARCPSRAHVLRCCSHTPDCRVGVRLPVHRIKERLLACVVPEIPGCPVVLDPGDPIQDMAEALEKQLRQHGRVVVATAG